MMTNFRLSGESGEAVRIEGVARESGTRKWRFFDLSEPESGKEPEEEKDKEEEEGEGGERLFVCNEEEC